MRASVGRPRLTRHLGVTSALAAAVALLSACSGGTNTSVSAPSTTSGASTSATRSSTSDTASTTTTTASASDNGISTQSAEQIAKRATSTMKAVNSVKMTGWITQDGKRVEITALFDDGGRNCSMDMTQGRGKATILLIGKTTYIKANKAFYEAQGESAKQSDSMLSLLDGRWLKQAADEDDLDTCNIDEIIDGDKDDSTVESKGAVTSVDGVPAISVVSKDDDGTSTGWVATTGKPYLLKMTHTGKEPGSMTFSDFEKPVSITAPPSSKVLDTDALGSSDT